MSKILLLSIRPKFSFKIFRGEKTVELRRVRPAVGHGDLVLVYTSSPECSLTGAFLVGEILAGTPKKIWPHVISSGGVTRDEFDQYFNGAETAYAIGIQKAWTFDKPVCLAELRAQIPRFHPPQSYRYMTPADFSSIVPATAAKRLQLGRRYHPPRNSVA